MTPGSSLFPVDDSITIDLGPVSAFQILHEPITAFERQSAMLTRNVWKSQDDIAGYRGGTDQDTFFFERNVLATSGGTRIPKPAISLSSVGSLGAVTGITYRNSTLNESMSQPMIRQLFRRPSFKSPWRHNSTLWIECRGGKQRVRNARQNLQWFGN